jgi:hypothetical protein
VAGRPLVGIKSATHIGRRQFADPGGVAVHVPLLRNLMFAIQILMLPLISRLALTAQKQHRNFQLEHRDSRQGHMRRGVLHKAIIVSLTKLPYQSTTELAAEYYHPPDVVKPYQWHSMRRALRRLAQEGVIEESLIPATNGEATWVLAVPTRDKARQTLRQKAAV